MVEKSEIRSFDDSVSTNILSVSTIFEQLKAIKLNFMVVLVSTPVMSQTFYQVCVLSSTVLLQDKEVKRQVV